MPWWICLIAFGLGLIAGWSLAAWLVWDWFGRK
jgi:hypothetical protein